MKIQRSTGILLGVAIALTAAVAIFETQGGRQSSSGETLFNFAESDVSALTVERDDTTLAFTKIDNSWQMTEPEETPADPSSVAFLLNIITNDTIQETLTSPSDQLDTYGLENPKAVVNLTVNDENYTLAIGDEDFSGTSLYVMTTPDMTEADPVNVFLIPQGIENGIERPVNDWIAKNEDESTTAEPLPESDNPTSSDGEVPRNSTEAAE